MRPVLLPLIVAIAAAVLSLARAQAASAAATSPIPLLPPSGKTVSVQPETAAPPQRTVPPPVTYALLPGHWDLHGARYVWVPPETHLRRVEDRPLIQGHYAWRDGNWLWVPSHYGSN